MLICSPPYYQQQIIWKTALISNIANPVNPELGPDSLPSAVVWPRGLVPSGGPHSPNYRLQTYKNLPHHFHIAVFHCFHCCVVLCVVWDFSFHSLVFCSPSLPSNHHAYIPPCPSGSGCTTSAAAVLAKNRCPRNTSPVREKEWEREGKRMREEAHGGRLGEP